MSLPEQLMERIGREPVSTPGWSSQLLMFSGTVFFISVAVYVGLAFGYKPYLEGQVSDLDNQIKSFSQKIPPEEQNKLISFYSQIANLQSVLGSRTTPSGLFSWLEKNTDPNVYYTKLNFLSSSNQLNLSGVSRSADDFSKQIVAFQSDKIVKKISLNSFNALTSGAWQFDVTLSMADKAFARSVIQTSAQQ